MRDEIIPISGDINSRITSQESGIYSRSRNSESIGRRLDEFPLERQTEMNDWALQCAHRCLIAQGDLGEWSSSESGMSVRNR